MKGNSNKVHLMLLSFARKWQMSKQMTAVFLTGALLTAGAVNITDEGENQSVLSGTNEMLSQVVQDEPLSEDYEVWINGIKAVVYIARAQDPPFEKEGKEKFDYGGNYSFTSFDINRPIEVKIRSLKKSLDNTIIRPDKAEVRRLVKSSNEITFSIDKPVKLSIEPDGKNSPLLVFANPVIDYKPARDDKNVIYFGAGIHRPDSSIIRVRDNQTLYLDEGAIVKAAVIVYGNNATICGRGILDGNEYTWRKYAPNSIIIRGNNVVVKDIIVRGAAEWTFRIQSCHHIVVDNIKILGGRLLNDDGIDPCNSQDILIKNCFIRTYDDCLAFKGRLSAPMPWQFFPDTWHVSDDIPSNTERITVENSILWGDRARIILLGAESKAEYMRDLVFRNIDIIHWQAAWPIVLLAPYDEMKLQNVLFENIRVNGAGQKELIRLKMMVNQSKTNKVAGHINNITFRNITVTGAAGDYKIVLGGADEKHIVSDITLSDVSILGNKLRKDSKNFEIGNHVNNVTVK